MVFIKDGFGCRTNLHACITKTYEVRQYYFDLWVSTYGTYWLTNVNESGPVLIDGRQNYVGRFPAVLNNHFFPEKNKYNGKVYTIKYVIKNNYTGYFTV